MRIQSSTIRHIPYLLLDLSVLLLLAYAIFFRATFPDPGIRIDYKTGIINNLDTEGFLYQHGMRSQDQLISINDIPWPKATSVYDGAKVGKESTWRLNREGILVHIVSVLPALSWSQRLQNIIPLFVALVYWGIATFLWLYNPQHKLIRRFFPLSQLVAVTLVGGSLDAYTVRWGLGIYLFAILLITPVGIHFFSSFPLNYQTDRVKFLVKGTYLFSLFLSIPLIFFLWGHPFLWPNEITLALIFFFLIAAIALSITFLIRHWYNAPLLVKQRRHLILAGILASLFPVLFFYFFPSISNHSPGISSNWIYLGLIFFPMSVAFALYSGELGRIDWFLNRSLVNILLFGLMASFYMGLYLTLSKIIPKTNSLFLPISTIIFLLLAMLFAPLHRLLRYGVDQLFYQGWYDYQTVMKKTGEDLLTVKHPEDLAHALLENLTTSMRLQCVCILLPISQKNNYVRLYVHAPRIPALTELSSELFSIDAPFYQTLQKLKTTVDTDFLISQMPISALTPQERALLNRKYIQLWIPVSLQMEQFPDQTGVLIIGTKLDGEPFTTNDKIILDNTARYVAIVVQKLQLLTQLQQREKELTHLYKNQTLTREEERSRIARDLHDNIIQDLHVIHYKLQGSHPHTLDEAQDIFENSSRLLQESIDDIRRICQDLRPVTLDLLGLPDALRTLARQLNQRTGIDVEVLISGNEDTPLSNEIEDMLFRITQEALWNVEKHAKAQHVTIHLLFPDETNVSEHPYIRLIIEDDGQGFDVPAVFDELLTRNAYGLLNMQERASIISGQFKLYSQPGQGVRIEVEAPIELDT